MLRKLTVLMLACNIICFLFVPDILAGEKLNLNRMLVEEAVGAGTGFVGGMVAMGIFMAVEGGGNSANDYWNSFILGSIASSALGVYYIGRYGGDEGSYLWALAGSLGGALLGYTLGAGKKSESFALCALLLPILQSAGGVVGFNFLRMKNALISSDGKGVTIAVPMVYLSGVNGGSGGLMARVNLLELTF